MSLVPSLRVFRHRAYAHYWVMRQLLSGSRQMQAVAIGWQVYDLARQTRSVEESAFVLGLVGLAQFLPVLVFSLVGGQAADRFDRKMILVVSNLGRVVAGIVLVASVAMPADEALPVVFAMSVVMGAVNAFAPAASNALYPTLVPREDLAHAIAWNSLGFQVSAVAGPALGGLLYAWGGEVVYAVSTTMVAGAILAIATAKTPKQEPVANARGLAMAIEGLRYVRDNKIVLGAILIDLVVVFFGGATALLPVFARDVLHTGADGLGLLRAAPAFGAAIVALALALRPLERKVGPWMLWSIVVYGAATLGFGVSKVFWLSMAMLAVTGAADMISVYVRQALIQFATPDAMRGRVASVSFMFISASNELGEFESGIAARFLGPVGAVVLGGTVAIATALAWFRLFPQMATADRFEEPAILVSEPERLEPRIETKSGA
ncbi:MAG: MFS transporter [Parvularculaceae bacterium]|nr:MFS transporter [Parvularculaceae bacterium]